MVALESIGGPHDLEGLTTAELDDLAARDPLLPRGARLPHRRSPRPQPRRRRADASRIHRVFDSPRDTVVFDTGHQSYVHKLLTGRHDFSGLRTQGGLSGYPSRAESEHDVVENSHASTALSWADGIARARALRGERDRHRGRVIGDGALTGGMAWEALNNIAAAPTGRSSSSSTTTSAPTPRRSAAWPTTSPRCARPAATSASSTGARTPWRRTPVVGGGAYETLHGVKKGIKDVVAPQGMFEDLGLKYLGPVDGHDVAALEHALRRARASAAPCSCTCITQKGRGYAPGRARRGRPLPRRSATSTPRPACRSAAPAAPGPTSSPTRWSRSASERPDVVAITAAMMHPVGLDRFARSLPRARLRRRHRRAARHHHARPAWRSPACTRSSPSTPPSSTAPSTSC